MFGCDDDNDALMTVMMIVMIVMLRCAQLLVQEPWYDHCSSVSQGKGATATQLNNELIPYNLACSPSLS